MKKKKAIVLLVIISLVIAILGAMSVANFAIPGYKNGIYDYNSIFSSIARDSDLEGGVYVVLESDDDEITSSQMKTALNVVKQRLDALEMNSNVYELNGNKIRAEFDDSDSDDVIELLGAVGLLEVKDGNETDSKVLFTGSDVKEATGGYDANYGYLVQFMLNKGATKTLAEATKTLASNSGKIYLYLDGELLTESGISISQEITDGLLTITGLSDAFTAVKLVTLAKTDLMPVTFTGIDSGYVGAFLGDKAKTAIIIAGVVALVLAFILMVVFFKGFGLISIIAMLGYFFVYVLLLALMPWTELSLSAIIGVFMSCIITAVFMIIIIQKIKAEFKAGKTLKFSIKNAFKGLVWNILDISFALTIGSAILWILGGAKFANACFVLVVGTILSTITLFTLFWLLINIFTTLNKSKKFYNLKCEVIDDEI